MPIFLPLPLETANESEQHFVCNGIILHFIFTLYIIFNLKSSSLCKGIPVDCTVCKVNNNELLTIVRTLRCAVRIFQCALGGTSLCNPGQQSFALPQRICYQIVPFFLLSLAKLSILFFCRQVHLGVGVHRCYEAVKRTLILCKLRLVC